MLVTVTEEQQYEHEHDNEPEPEHYPERVPPDQQKPKDKEPVIVTPAPPIKPSHTVPPQIIPVDPPDDDPPPMEVPLTPPNPRAPKPVR